MTGSQRDLLQRPGAGLHPDAAPEVSILIPTFQHEGSIERAIQSALMQDFDALEVIVLDDASTDATYANARRWECDPRFRIRRNPVNLGRVANYLDGLEKQARGRWVLMLDGDDFLLDSGFITRAMDVLAEHASDRPLFAQAGQRLLLQPGPNHDGRQPLEMDILPAIDGETQLMTGAQYLQLVLSTGFFSHLGTLYSRHAAVEQGFYTRDISSSDMESLLTLALSGKVVLMKTLAGCWVEHGSNTSSNLPLNRVAENTALFRSIVRRGAEAGTLDMRRIAPDLIRHEVRTLVHLFNAALEKGAGGMSDFIAMCRITWQVNPRLLLDPMLLRFWRQHLRQLLRLSRAASRSVVPCVPSESIRRHP